MLLFHCRSRMLKQSRCLVQMELCFAAVCYRKVLQDFRLQ